MKYPFVTGVAGVSFRQDAVRSTHVDDEVLLRHEADNPYDSGAVAIYTSAGEHMGYLPAGVARRVVSDVGNLGGRVVEVLAGDTYGLRVQISEGATRAGSVNEADMRESTHLIDTQAQEDDLRVWVYSKAGRLLGHEVGTAGTQIIVVNGAGEEVRYPAAVVQRQGAHSS